MHKFDAIQAMDRGSALRNIQNPAKRAVDAVGSCEKLDECVLQVDHFERRFTTVCFLINL